MLLSEFKAIIVGFFGIIESFLKGCSQVVLIDMGPSTPNVTLLSLLFVSIFVSIVTMFISGIVGKDTYNSGGSKSERPKGRVSR